MAESPSDVRPAGSELDRRSFLKGSSAVAVGSVLAAAGLGAGAAEAAPAPPAGEAVDEPRPHDLKAGWLAG